MNTNQVEWFCAAYEAGSFAKASAATYVSRQAFGKAIKALEGELGVELFFRDEAGVAPTEAAKALYPLMRRMVNTERAIRETCSELLLESREPVRIAVADGIVESLPQGFFALLERSCPRADIMVEKHFYMRCLELLHDGSVDFAICAGPVSDEGLLRVLLVREPVYIGMAPCDAPGRERADATLEDFADLVYYTVGEGESGSLGAQREAERQGVSMRFDGRYSEYNMLLDRVLQGGGAVGVPENVAERARSLGLALVPFPGGEVEWQVLFLYDAGGLFDGEGLSPAKRDVVRFMRSHGVSPS